MKKKIMLALLLFFMAITGTACANKQINTNKNTDHEEQLQIFKSDLQLTQDQVLSKIKAEHLKKNNGYLDSDEIISIITLSEESLMDRYLAKFSNRYSSVSKYALSAYGETQIEDIYLEQEALIAELKENNLITSVEYQYTTILNAIAVKTTYGNFKELGTLGKVSSTLIADTFNQPQGSPNDASAIENIVDVYETGIFNSSSVEYTGSGTAVAVLDSGFDLTHSVFANIPEDQMISQKDVERILPETKAKSFTENLAWSDVYYSGKVPFAYDYADKDDNVFPYDSNHGTHVAGIIGGKDEKITGVAIDTQLVLMKVFPDLSEGGKTDDILAALEDAVLLNVDAINLSLGSSCGFAREKDGDAINEVYDKINESGISLLTAASNSYSSGFGGEHGNTNFVTNPDSGTVGSPSTYAASLSVASISGVKSSYIIGNDSQVFFFKESNAITGDENDFIKELGIKPGDKKTFEYVTIPGVGKRINFDSVGDLTGKIALVRRGEITFEEKASNAKQAGAIACIIYNNIDGDILMSMGKTDHIPTVSISKDDGTVLAKRDRGTMTIAYSQQAGPFMSDFSSWGPLPSLQMKPEITAHGGNITSAVPGGGYDSISGTSMATPNLCGIVVLIRQHLKEKYPDMTWKEISVMTNELLMSTATIIKNEDGNPYSPRKQGAGLASLYNAVNTKGFVTVDGIDRAKLELFDDAERTGVYTMKFNVVNLSNETLKYDLSVIGMTESVSSSDKRHIAEKSKILSGATEIEVLSGGKLQGEKLTIQANDTAEVKVVYTLSAEDKSYIERLFPYGMYVEGFVQLVSDSVEEVDLNVPFLAFYGDWTQAPMFDKTYYEVESEAHNQAIDEEDKIKADYFATTPYGSYFYNYIIPLGTYLYELDSNKYDAIPANEDRIAISNYLGSIDGIFGVYAGQLRGAKTMQYTIVDKVTGEVLYDYEDYNARKAFSQGGGPIPGYEALNLNPLELGLVNNREYEFKMEGLLDYGDGGKNTNVRNSFSFDFTLDDEAPVIKDAVYEKVYDRNLKKDRFYVTLTIYDNHYVQSVTPIIFTSPSSYTFLSDNPIPVYSEKGQDNKIKLEITDYLDEIYADGLITSALGFSVDDYALNSSIYLCQLPGTKGDFKFTKDGSEDSSEMQILSVFENEIVDLTRYLSTADKSVDPDKDFLKHLQWSSSNEKVAQIKDGQLRAIKPGRTIITVVEQMDLKQAVLIVNVKKNPDKITEQSTSVLHHNAQQMSLQSTSQNGNYNDARLESIRFSYFDTIFAYSRAGQTSEIGATGDRTFFTGVPSSGGTANLSFYPGEKIQLFHALKPWYVEDKYELSYKSHNPEVADVDEDGIVTGLKRGTAIIELGVKGSNLTAQVRVTIKSEFIIENRTLIAYKGLGGKVVIPDDEGILFIGAYAFCLYETDQTIELDDDDYDKNKIPAMNTSITSVVIPEGVEEIQKYAFYNCPSLRTVELPESVKFIREHAFEKGVSLKTINLENVESIGKEAFRGCENLEIAALGNVYAIGQSAFEGASSLKTVDLSALRNTGERAFKDCISLETVILTENTRLSRAMFVNTGLIEIDIYERVQIPEFCFAQSENLAKVTIHNDLISIGKGAFSECPSLVTFDIKGYLDVIGEQAFYGSTGLETFVLPDSDVRIDVYAFYKASSLTELVFLPNTRIIGLTASVFRDTNLLTFSVAEDSKYYIVNESFLVEKDGKKIILSAFAVEYDELVIGNEYNEISAGAFSGANIKTLTITNPNLKIGEAAFAYCAELLTLNLPEEAGVIIGARAFEFAENLENITNLDKIKVVEDYAFAQSGVRNLVLGNNVEFGEGVFFRSKLEEVTIGEGSTFGNGAFQYCLNLKTVHMPEGGNVNFGSGAFAFSRQLEHIDLSKVGPVIEEITFLGCTSLKSANLLNVEEIGDYAFADCENLNYLNIPKVVIIGEGAFSRYDKNGEAPQFGDLILPNTLTTIKDGAFLGCRGFVEVVIPESVTELGGFVFAYSINLTTVVLPDNLTTINQYTFVGCEFLTTINLENIKTIGDYAFTGTTLLKTVDLSSVESIGEGAFATSGITGSLTLNKLTKLSDYAFQEANITTFTAPHLREIGVAAFQSNEKLQKFVFSNSLEKVDSLAFLGCSHLSKFYFVENGKEVSTGTINDYAFLENGILYTVLKTGKYELTSIPSGLKQDTVEILEGTTRIDIYAGNENPNIKKLVFPDSLKTIGNYAFYKYINLKEVEFKSVTAPILESNYAPNAELEEDDPGYDIIHKYFNVFGWELCYFTFIDLVGKKEPIKMTLPANENITGYDSLIYLVYFGKVTDAERSNYEAMSKNMIDFIENFAIIEKIDIFTLAHEKLVDKALTAYNGINQDHKGYGYSDEQWEAMATTVKNAKAYLTKLKIELSANNLKSLQERILALPTSFDISQLEILKDISAEINALKIDEKVLLDLTNYNKLLDSYHNYTKMISDEVAPILNTISVVAKIMQQTTQNLTIGYLIIVLKRGWVR